MRTIAAVKKFRLNRVCAADGRAGKTATANTDEKWERFMESAPLPEDFGEIIFEARTRDLFLDRNFL